MNIINTFILLILNYFVFDTILLRSPIRRDNIPESCWIMTHKYILNPYI